MSTLRRIPFALALIAAIGVVALTTSGPGFTSRPDEVAHWGFALHDLWTGRFWSIVTAAFFMHRPYLFPVTAVFVLASAGVHEWRSGTRRALGVFWVGDIASTLLLALLLVLPLHMSGTDIGATLAHADDVGMSGGGFACLGAWMIGLRGRWRWAAIGAVVAFLAVDLFSPSDMEADLLHMVAFPLGMALDRGARRWFPRQE